MEGKKLEDPAKPKIREIEIDGEKVYLRKDFLGWRIVNPIKNTDGTTNWFNLILGSKRNALLLLFSLIIVGVFLFVYLNDINSLKAYYKATCMPFRFILEGS